MSPSPSVHESPLWPLCPLLSAFIHVPTFPHFHVKKKKNPRCPIMSSVNISFCISKIQGLFSKTGPPYHHHTKNKWTIISYMYRIPSQGWMSCDGLVDFFRLVCLNQHPNKPTHSSLASSYSLNSYSPGTKYLSLGITSSVSFPDPECLGCLSSVPSQRPVLTTL